MDITPSSSRALRQRLWTLFNTHSSVEADVNVTSGSSSSNSHTTPAPSLTRSGFLSCLDALTRRGSFRGLFLGSEENSAIQGAAAELQLPATQDTLWHEALVYEQKGSNSREGRQQVTAAAAAVAFALTSPFENNDHYAEEDFFGEACYRGGGGDPRAQFSQTPPGGADTASQRIAEGVASVGWRALYAVVVLYLYDQRGFVHSFLPSEVAALRRSAKPHETAVEGKAAKKEKQEEKEGGSRRENVTRHAGATPSGKVRRVGTPTKQRASDRLPLRSQPVCVPSPRRAADSREGTTPATAAAASPLCGTPDVSPRRNAAFSSTMTPPPRLGAASGTPSTVITVEASQPEDNVAQGLPPRNLTGVEGRPHVSVASTKLSVALPDPYAPVRRDAAVTGSPRAALDAVGKPAPPPLRKHTQREAAELSCQHITDSPREETFNNPQVAPPSLAASSSAATAAAAAAAAVRFDGPVLSYPRNASRRASNTEAPGPTSPRAPPPVVSCPSVSVSVSSASSCGPIPASAVVAVAAAPADVTVNNGSTVVAAEAAAGSSSRRLFTTSPSPRRPEETAGSAVVGTTGVSSVVVNAPPRVGRENGGKLRQRSSSEVNVVQAAVKVKPTDPHLQNKTKGQQAAQGDTATTALLPASSPLRGAREVVIPFVEGERRRPKLACATHKPRGQRRVYTTRRPHAWEHSSHLGEGDGEVNTFATTTTTADLAVVSVDAKLTNTVGSHVPLAFNHPRPALAEVWAGRRREPSPDLPPPTTRNDDGLLSSIHRTASPSPCMPLPPGQGHTNADINSSAATAAALPSPSCHNSGRCGTVEHVVEGRRTTAMPMQVMTERVGEGGETALRSSPLPEAVRFTSVEKPAASPTPARGANDDDIDNSSESDDAPLPPSARVNMWAEERESTAASQCQGDDATGFVPLQPPTQTSRRRHHQPLPVAQPSPFSTTREPFSLATDAPSFLNAPSAAAPSQRGAVEQRCDFEQRQTANDVSRRLAAAAAPRVTAPSPTPTPRDELSDRITRSSSSAASLHVTAPAAPAQASVQLITTQHPPPPPPPRVAPPVKPSNCVIEPPQQRQRRNKTENALHSPPTQQQPKQKLQQPPQRLQSIRAPSPPQLIGVPRILSSTFTSPLTSARGSPRQLSAPSSAVSATRGESVHAKPTQNTAPAVVKAYPVVLAPHVDPQADCGATDAEVKHGTFNNNSNNNNAEQLELSSSPPHQSPDAVELTTHTPVNLLSPLMRQRLLPPPSPLTTPRRPPPTSTTEVTTPPPRLSHRARVRSSSRISRAAPTPPRIPQTRMQLSPSGSLQVTPRRRAPSTSSLLS